MVFIYQHKKTKIIIKTLRRQIMTYLIILRKMKNQQQTPCPIIDSISLYSEAVPPGIWLPGRGTKS